MRLWAIFAVWAWVVAACAAPQMLLKDPLASPGNKYAANVEWDAAGFIGRLRMLAYTTGETPSALAELPQINPSPANLTWISDTWFACESFVAENGAAFCYMNVPTGRAYMIEMFAPDKEDNWLISYTTNDRLSSDSIQTVSDGHSSLFPILLRDLPKSGLAYLSPDFAFLLSDAVDSFVGWRKQQGFKELKILSKVANDPQLGRLLIADVDNKAEIIYFPGGTTSTREMLALTQRKALPEGVQHLINDVDPPTLSAEWTDKQGAFRVLAQWDDRPSSLTEVVAGKFEGVSDAPYTGPGVSQLLDAGSDGSGKSGSSGDKKIVVEDSKKEPSSKSGGKTSSKTDSSSSKKKSMSSSKSSSSKSSGKSKKPSRSD